MLMPKKVKHRKQMRGRMTGVATRGSEISFGEYGLKCLEPAWITDRHFFFFNDTATTEIYTLSLHDALPFSPLGCSWPSSSWVFDRVLSSAPGASSTLGRCG